MAGMMKKLSNQSACVFTGKGPAFGGSLMRPEATGYGTVYFAQEMLHRRGRDFDGLRVLISGSGNVAQYAAQKAMELGAKVLTVSDSGGVLHYPEGMRAGQLEELMAFKNEERGRLSDFAARHGLRFEAERTPWHVPADGAAVRDAERVERRRRRAPAGQRRVLRGRGREHAVHAGGGRPFRRRASSMHRAGQQRRRRGHLRAGDVAERDAAVPHHAEVDEKLHAIMKDIHQNCIHHGQKDGGYINYVEGANIAGFVKVADAMLAQGVI